MGPSARPTGFQGTPISPRPGGARPTSELLGSNVNFQTPEGACLCFFVASTKRELIINFSRGYRPVVRESPVVRGYARGDGSRVFGR
jgi:hypothetical protein